MEREELDKARKRAAEQVSAPYGRCETCKQLLGIFGGYGGTELCGPCVTGEAKTSEEYGETW